MSTQEKVFKTQEGIEIKLKRVPPLLLQAVQSSFPPPPDPPMVVVEFNGKQEREQNPADPDYLNRVRQHDEERSMAVMDLLLTKGTVLPYTDEEIEQMFNELQEGIDIPLKGSKRVVVLKSLLYGDDIKGLMEAVQDSSIVTERVVQKKADAF